MKILIFLFIIVSAVFNWKTVADIFGIQIGPVKYKQGNYSSNKWHWGNSGYKQASIISDEQQSPMLIYVYADWCRYCKEFQSTLLKNSEVKSTLKNFIKVKLNPDKNPEDKKLYQQWGGKGYPTLLLQSGSSNLPIRIRAPFYRQGSGWKLLDATSFINLLNKHST